MPLRFDALEDRCVPATIVVTSPGDSGGGTLRQAILDSNASTSVDDEIRIDVDTIDLSTALPTLTDDVAIRGNTEAVIRRSETATAFFRFFDVAAGVNASFDGLILTGALNDADGGAIRNLGNLTIANSQVVKNGLQNDFGAPLYGGGIYSCGTLHIENSYIGLNIVQGANGIDGIGGLAGGGGLAIFGGCATLDTVSIDRNTVAGGSGAPSYGGGVYLDAGNLTTTHSAFTRNTVNGIDAEGGGMFNEAGHAELTLSTVAFNTATIGGGLRNGNGTVTLDRSIIATNSASSGTDLFGFFESAGHNLIRVVGTATVNGGPNDIFGPNPHLIQPELYTEEGDGLLTWSPPLPTLPRDSVARGAGPGGTDIGATSTSPNASQAVYSSKTTAALGSGSSAITYAIGGDGTSLFRHTPANGWQLVATGVRSFSATVDPAGNEVLFAIFNEHLTLRRWRPANGWDLLGYSVTSISAGRDSAGQPLAWVTGADGALNVWRTSGGWMARPLTGPHSVRSISATDDNRCVVLLEGGSIRVYTPTSSTLIASAGFARSLDAVSIGGTLTVYAITQKSDFFTYSPAQGWAKRGAQVAEVWANSAGTAPVAYLLTANSAPYRYDTASGFQLLGLRGSVRSFSQGRGGATAAITNDYALYSYAPGWKALTSTWWAVE